MRANTAGELIVRAERPLIPLPSSSHQLNARVSQPNRLMPTRIFDDRRPARRDEIKLDGVTTGPPG